jgi:hypothetical protein
VKVLVGVNVCVDVLVGVLVGVSVCVDVLVAVLVGVSVCVDVLVGMLVGVDVCVEVLVGGVVGVGVGCRDIMGRYALGVRLFSVLKTGCCIIVSNNANNPSTNAANLICLSSISY